MFGIGMGPTQNEKNTYGNLTAASGFATNLGESDLTASSDFMKAILSGDSSKISQALAPQISGAKQRAQQQKKTTAEFGSRSGGTAASMAGIDDATHASITDLIGTLTGQSVSGLSSAGSSALGAGMSGYGTAFNEANTMQQQSQAQMGDIFNSIAGIAGVAGGFVPGAGGKLLKGIGGILQS
jgi:hypothetical protein